MMANDWALWKQFMEGQTTEEQLAEYISRMSEPGKVAWWKLLCWMRKDTSQNAVGRACFARIRHRVARRCTGCMSSRGVFLISACAAVAVGMGSGVPAL